MMPEKVPFTEQCESQMMPDYRDDVVLVCYLRIGHEGPHWDQDDDVTWWVARHSGPPRADNDYSVK